MRATLQRRARRAKGQRHVSYTGARPDVLRALQPRVGQVLDVGCSSGALGAALCEHTEATVCGIEVNPAFADAARKRLSRVIEDDALMGIRVLIQERASFDTLIFADCLEHLADPGTVLTEAVRLLRPGGQCVVSLPNVRFYSTLTSLLFYGRWPRKPRGVHDSTHLAWFTRRDALDLVASAGLRVRDLSANYRLIDSPHRVNRLARAAAVPLVREFLAYQYILACVKPGSPSPASTDRSDHERSTRGDQPA